MLTTIQIIRKCGSYNYNLTISFPFLVIMWILFERWNRLILEYVIKQVHFLCSQLMEHLVCQLVILFCFDMNFKVDLSLSKYLHSKVCLIFKINNSYFFVFIH